MALDTAQRQPALQPPGDIAYSVNTRRSRSVKRPREKRVTVGAMVSANPARVVTAGTGDDIAFQFQQEQH